MGAIRPIFEKHKVSRLSEAMADPTSNASINRTMGSGPNSLGQHIVSDARLKEIVECIANECTSRAHID